MKPQPRVTTLLNLVTELAVAHREQDLVEAVIRLIDRKQVELIGQVRACDLAEAADEES